MIFIPSDMDMPPCVSAICNDPLRRYENLRVNGLPGSKVTIVFGRPVNSGLERFRF